jgi:hypothetical protein
VPAPGHCVRVRSQDSSVATFEFQKGQVRHCCGRASYMRHRRVAGSKNVQSPLANSVNEVNPRAGRPGVHQPDFSNRLIKMLSDRPDLLVGHPDVSGGPGAAVSALRAAERQAGSEPRWLSFCWRTHGESAGGAIGLHQGRRPRVAVRNAAPILQSHNLPLRTISIDVLQRVTIGFFDELRVNSSQEVLPVAPG